VPISSLRGSKGKNRKAFRALVEKPEGKSPSVITTLLLEDSIRMDLTEIGRAGLGRIHPVQDRDGSGRLFRTQ
jgi:hypothetical protein